MIVLLLAWLMFTLFLMSKDEKVLHYRQLAIPKGDEIRSKLNKHESLVSAFNSLFSFSF